MPPFHKALVSLHLQLIISQWISDPCTLCLFHTHQPSHPVGDNWSTSNSSSRLCILWGRGEAMYLYTPYNIKHSSIQNSYPTTLLNWNVIYYPWIIGFFNSLFYTHLLEHFLPQSTGLSAPSSLLSHEHKCFLWLENFFKNSWKSELLS